MPPVLLVEYAGLRKAVGDGHRSDGGHDPRQQRDRADLRHVRRQHDDAGAHHVHGDHERELHYVHLLLSQPYRFSFSPAVGRHSRTVRLNISASILLRARAPAVMSSLHAVARGSTPSTLFGALDFLGESRKHVAVLLQRAQVGEPRTVGAAEAFTRHHDRNAGWIGNDTDGDDAIGHLVERHLLGVAGHQPLERAPRRHLGRRQRGVGLRLPVTLPALAQLRPHLVAEILEALAGIALRRAARRRRAATSASGALRS